MSLARHNFAKIVPTDKSKLGSRVYSPSQITTMIKANANTTAPKRFAFGISAFYRVNSGAINDYRTLTGIRRNPIVDGDLIDGSGGANLQILEGNDEVIQTILDGN